MVVTNVGMCFLNSSASLRNLRHLLASERSANILALVGWVSARQPKF